MIEIKNTPKDRALFIDGMCQGRAAKDGTPLSPYMKPIMERMVPLPKGAECLFLGGGLYVLPKWAENRGYSVSVIELDKNVQAAARPFSDSFYMGIGDILEVLPTLETEWFDFILLDIWPNDPRAYCEEYFRECKAHLKKGGLFAMNYIDNKRVPLEAMGKIVATVWPNVNMTTFYSDKDLSNPSQGVYFAN